MSVEKGPIVRTAEIGGGVILAIAGISAFLAANTFTAGAVGAGLTAAGIIVAGQGIS